MLKQITLNRFIIRSFVISIVILQASNSLAQRILATSELKKLSVEELMNIEVTSVSRRTEKLSKTASAIQVITKEDIKRFGATRLPEALRLATNLEVAQVDAGQWAVSARGFNASTGNKLLVLIDGRTVYSPLFAGVFWDIQDVLLDDVERIEVISGPGGTLWGANAVNGVINIITKNTKSSNGLLVKAATGNESKLLGAIRYGGSITPQLNFRAYGKYLGYDDTVLPNGSNAHNNWDIGQSGFRLDWDDEERNAFALQGDLYKSKILTTKEDSLTTTRGGNLLGKWSHKFSETSDLKIQFYYDRVHRMATRSYNDILNTYDFDGQYRVMANERHDVVAGLGYRMIDDDFGPGNISFQPRHRTLDIYSAFIQDEIALMKERLFLTIGTKAQHNTYSKFEFQPSARLAWNLVASDQTLWAAVSRAVRTPSRVDRDLVLPPFFVGGPNFKSEVLWAYELGYRIKPHEKISVSLATYFNAYDKIRTAERINPPAPFPEEIKNGSVAESYGAEFTTDYQINPWWRLRFGYTYLNLNIWSKPWSTDITHGKNEGNDPNHMLALRSSFDLPGHFKLFPAYRHVSKITSTMNVPAYSELDVRLAWEPGYNFEISITGQNLLHNHHAEFGNEPTSVNPTSRKQIERNVYLSIVWR